MDDRATTAGRAHHGGQVAHISVDDLDTGQVVARPREHSHALLHLHQSGDEMTADETSATSDQNHM
jgi:hypothetical protein